MTGPPNSPFHADATITMNPSTTATSHTGDGS